MGSGTIKETEGPPIAIRPMERTARDLELFDACFTRNGAPRDPAVLRWQYLENPTGAMFVDFAVAKEDRLAAIYASIPVVFRIAGERRLAIQSCDSMTDAEFRKRGLFVTLGNRTYARAAEAGAVLVYGTPNWNSAHGIFQRLEWHDLNPVPFLIRPLRTRWVLQKLELARAAALLPDIRLPVGRGRPDAQRVERFDERFTRLWSEFSRGIRVAVERDARYLNWRLGRPGVEYRSSFVSAGGAGADEVAAFVSHSVQDRDRSRIGYIMEAMCTEAGARPLRGLIRGALADMIAQGADVALARCFPHSPNYASYLRTGFVPFPRRLWPIELHFGARSFDASLAREVNDRRSWYLSYLDCDTV